MKKSKLQIQVNKCELAIVLDDPEALNAIGPTMAAELLGVLEKIKFEKGMLRFEGQELKILSLRAKPMEIKNSKQSETRTPVWGSGGNLKELKKIDTPEEASRYSENMTRVCNYLERLPIPSYCLIDGRVLGGHVELALSCDQVILTERSSLEFRQLKMGLILGYGVSERLVKRLGFQRLMKALLGTEVWTSTQSLEWGAAANVCADWASLIDEFSKIKETVLEMQSPVIHALKSQLVGDVSFEDVSALTLAQCQSVSAFGCIWKNPKHLKALSQI